ncbi:DUF3261 domain-containing protein [Reyranella sp. CPCC 100927]|uniref:DUF3261 domain-containing protein n=1 Tax=Reyranella sp. CPCC 100927 TaxID=2599616 RepID=UPI0015B38358|nr:DUF3261 domain-containing protein [Reyranella sp. CPCC 100927]
MAVSPGVIMTLPGPADLGRSVDVAQMIIARYGERSVTFESRLSVTPQRVLMVSTDSAGRRAMTIEWSARGIEADIAPWVPRQLRPVNVLADLVFLYWPETVLRAAFSGSPVTLMVSPGRRALYQEGRELIWAEHTLERLAGWPRSSHYRNLAWGYELMIKSAEVTP